MKDILRRARELIATGWSQGTYYRRNGSACNSVDGPNQFCAVGAIMKAEAILRGSRAAHYDLSTEKIAGTLAKLVYADSLACWNDEDGRTQEEVLALFDKALA